MRADGLQVAEMVEPRWATGNRPAEIVVPSPTLQQVEQAIEDLDGNQLNDLYLRTSDAQTYLGIGGGAGRYMVAICDRGQRFGQLINTHDHSDDHECIMCGGQHTSLPRRHLVGLAAALTAARHYLASAEASPRSPGSGPDDAPRPPEATQDLNVVRSRATHCGR